MTVTSLPEGFSPDAELVGESRRGNRDAFGRIVRRYQGMVAGVIYSVCGDLHRSEDLAQETFIAAWKSLSGMNDPEKLAPWLCQIARRKAVDFQRSNLREKNRLSHLFPVLTAGESTSPPQEALAKEEREMLWRILSELPQRYRETMVLYYRQEQSTAAVALETGITEDAVRQRLTRGREMLRDQMAEVLERNLVRSAPTPAFAAAVMAALSATTPPAAKAATLGAAAKGSTVLGSGGATAWGSTLLGGLVAAWGGVFALRRALRASRSGRESRFLVIFAGLGALCMTAWWTASVVAPRMFDVHDFHGLGAMVLPISVTIATLIIIRLGRGRLTAIRATEPSDRAVPNAAFAGNPGKMPRAMAVAVVFASMSVWFGFAWRAGDFLSVAILSTLAIGLAVVAAYCWGGDSIGRSRRFSLLIMPILGIITLGITKWRLNEWLGVIHHWSHPHPMRWSGLLLPATLFACGQAVAMELVGFWKRNPRTRPSGDVSVGPVRQLDLIGFNFLHVDQQVTLKTIPDIARLEASKLRAAMKTAQIEPCGPVVFIYENMTNDPNAVMNVKIGIAVKENPTAPEGYQVEEIRPANCQTVLYGGPMSKIAQAFQVLGPALYAAAAPTGEIRVYCLYFESADSPNNATLIAAVLNEPTHL
jgi:RNA polymerase sigma factor (sigma-70 family)